VPRRPLAIQTFAPEQRRHDHHISRLAARPRYADHTARAACGDVALKLGKTLIGGAVGRIEPPAAVER
jgi:hypothetical protein